MSLSTWISTKDGILEQVHSILMQVLKILDEEEILVTQIIPSLVTLPKKSESDIANIKKVVCFQKLTRWKHFDHKPALIAKCVSEYIFCLRKNRKKHK